MNKNFLACALAGLALIGMAGCSNDTVAPVAGNETLTYKKGDVFKYEYYEHDSTNAKIDASKKIKTWTVLDTNLSYAGKNRVTRVQQVTTDGDGTSNPKTDTVYVLADATGDVYQYNLVGQMVTRIPAAATYGDSIPKQWVLINNTKASGAGVALASAGISLFNITVPVSGNNVPVALTTKMNGASSGTDSFKLANATYAHTFGANHSLSVFGQTTILGQTFTVLNDSMAFHSAVSVDAGIVREWLDSKKVNVDPGVIVPGTPPIPQPIPGFEMNLVSYSRGS
jgi:hypothetical protein